jgi:hypothetical protein
MRPKQYGEGTLEPARRSSLFGAAAGGGPLAGSLGGAARPSTALPTSIASGAPATSVQKPENGLSVDVCEPPVMTNMLARSSGATSVLLLE